MTFVLESRNSQVGLDALHDGAIDIALVSREMRAEEMSGLLATPIVRDGIAILVTAENPTGALTLEELRAIFTTGDFILGRGGRSGRGTSRRLTPRGYSSGEPGRGVRDEEGFRGLGHGR